MLFMENSESCKNDIHDNFSSCGRFEAIRETRKTSLGNVCSNMNSPASGTTWVISCSRGTTDSDDSEPQSRSVFMRLSHRNAHIE